MTDSNRTQLAYVVETTEGVTPGSPSMRKIRFTGESINYGIDTVISEEIRADRAVTDLVQVNARVNGGINAELSYGAFDDFIESAMFNTFINTPVKSGNTECTSVTGTNTFGVNAGGTSFKVGHLIRSTGYTTAGNNGLHRVSSSTGTGVTVGSTLVNESSTANSRLKIVGFRGASGDITATGTGLGSTLLDFTTLGLIVGQHVKIGGPVVGEQFATAANNNWARITAISATALTLDNLPSGWATDTGTGKTITVYFGDVIKVGTTKKTFTVEKGFLAQTVPTYIASTGMAVNRMELNVQSGSIVGLSLDFLGRVSTVGTTALSGSPAEAATNDVLNAVANAGRIAENGAAVTGPNFINSLSLTLNNNLREQTAVGTMGLIGVGAGRAEISGQLRTYFGSKALYEKFVNNTVSNVNFRLDKANKALVFTIPKIKFESGQVVAGGGNQDVMCDLNFRGLLDTLTSTSFQIDRLEEFA